MTTDSSLFDRQRAHLLYTWTAQRRARPLTVLAAEGARFQTAEHGWLWDLESQVYNVNVGHGHPHVRARMHAQIDALAAAAPWATLEVRAELAERLCEKTGLAKAFLATGGAEAVENALKIARLVTGRRKVLARRSSYHGATLATLEVGGDPRRAPFAALLGPGYYIDDPYPHGAPVPEVFPQTGAGALPSSWVQSLEAVLTREDPGTVAAILLEGFTGTNGMQPPPVDFWPRVRALCDQHGILLLIDEIFAGFGRTGAWFSFEHWGVRPDIVIFGKGLTSGYAALAGLAIDAAIAARFDDETLWCGLTSYAHPVSCAAALGSIEALEREGLVTRAAEVGGYLGSRLRALGPAIRDVRGLGMMWLVELDREVAPIAERLLARGVFAPHRGRWLFVCPPLCVTRADIDAICEPLAAELAALDGAPLGST